MGTLMDTLTAQKHKASWHSYHQHGDSSSKRPLVLQKPNQQWDKAELQHQEAVMKKSVSISLLLHLSVDEGRIERLLQ